MQVKTLKLTNFKNYKEQSFIFNSKYNAIVGLNGMGKTNLLDAIYFSCMTKSNFMKQDQMLVNKGNDFFRIEGHFYDEHKSLKVVSKYQLKGGKKIECNNKAYSRLAEHIGKILVVFIIPGDQNIILEGSKERRILLDNTLSQMNSDYLSMIMKYNGLLRQRNSYLKNTQNSGSFSQSLLLAYSEQMESAAKFIHKARQEFLNEFIEIFKYKYSTISKDQESVNVIYKSQMDQESFLEGTQQSLEKDRILARSTFGIHKDDLVFKMNDSPVKNIASQGQTKSFILSLKLSQYEILAKKQNVKPILLLDDLFDKLDYKRVEQLIELLENENVDQVFISDTDEDRIVNILNKMNVQYSKIVINSGKIQNRKNASEEE